MRLLFAAAKPVAWTGLGNVFGVIQRHCDRMKTGFTFVIGVVSDQVLAPDLLADPLHCLFKTFLLHERELGAASPFDENLRRAVDEDALRVSINLLQQWGKLHFVLFPV